MKPVTAMRLRVMLPTEVLVDRDVVKVIAEALDGEFCLEPRHVDFVAALVPGILTSWRSAEEPQYLAVDEGVLVKCGADVFVSVQDGVVGTDFSVLQDLIEDRFLTLDEQAQRVRTALARLEAGTLKRFNQLHEYDHATR